MNTITIQFEGVDLVVEFDFQPAEPDVGLGENIFINDLLIGSQSAFDLFERLGWKSPQGRVYPALVRIEELVWEAIKEERSK